MDDTWNILWPNTSRGEVAQEKCPGDTSVGMHLNQLFLGTHNVKTVYHFRICIKIV